jgi:purine catabolism regulator
MRVQDIIHLTIMREAQVIAGHNGLNRSVESVNMMDAPDILDFIKPNELLLTTAYLIKDDPNGLLTLVENMARTGCAALGLKAKKFLIQIPQDVIEAANELAFPIIEIPFYMNIGDLLYQVLSVVLEKKTEDLKYALDTHKQFTRLIFEGKGILSIIESLSSLLKLPIIFLNQNLEIKAMSRQFQIKVKLKLDSIMS